LKEVEAQRHHGAHFNFASDSVLVNWQFGNYSAPALCSGDLTVLLLMFFYVEVSVASFWMAPWTLRHRNCDGILREIVVNPYPCMASNLKLTADRH